MSLLDEVSSTLETAGIRHVRLLERAEPVGGTLVVRAADLTLLKLYAGGPQDAWDVQQLLARPFREDLIREVESRLSELPVQCRDLWKKILQG